MTERVTLAWQTNHAIVGIAHRPLISYPGCRAQPQSPRAHLLKCRQLLARKTKLNEQVGPSPLCVNPIFEIGPLEPRYSEYLVFEGISVDESGKQHFLDASLAYKRAVLNAIKYLANFGYTEEQVRLHPNPSLLGPRNLLSRFLLTRAAIC